MAAMDPVELVRLQRRIAVARSAATPGPWEEIAEREGMSVEQVQEIHRRHDEYRRLCTEPLGAISETVDLYDAVLQALGRLAGGLGASAASRIQANRAIAEVATRRLELLAAIGIVPRSPWQAFENEAVRRAMEEFGLLIKEFDLPVEDLDRILEVLESCMEEIAEARTLDARRRLPPG